MQYQWTVSLFRRHRASKKWDEWISFDTSMIRYMNLTPSKERTRRGAIFQASMNSRQSRLHVPLDFFLAFPNEANWNRLSPRPCCFSHIRKIRESKSSSRKLNRAKHFSHIIYFQSQFQYLHQQAKATFTRRQDCLNFFIGSGETHEEDVGKVSEYRDFTVCLNCFTLIISPEMLTIAVSQHILFLL